MNHSIDPISQVPVDAVFTSWGPFVGMVVVIMLIMLGVWSLITFWAVRAAGQREAAMLAENLDAKNQLLELTKTVVTTSVNVTTSTQQLEQAIKSQAEILKESTQVLKAIEMKLE